MYNMWFSFWWICSPSFKFMVLEFKNITTVCVCANTVKKTLPPEIMFYVNIVFKFVFHSIFCVELSQMWCRYCIWFIIYSSSTFSNHSASQLIKILYQLIYFPLCFIIILRRRRRKLTWKLLQNDICWSISVILDVKPATS